MQQDEKNIKTQDHDVDENNREQVEKTPPGSFTGTNIDRYVTGEISKLPDEAVEDNKPKPSPDA